MKKSANLLLLFFILLSFQNVFSYNAGQLEKIRHGTGIWNSYRIANPEAYIDLSRADLSNSELSEADLFRADLRFALLKKAILHKANLQNAYLVKTDFSQANLSHAKLQKIGRAHV